MEMMNASLALGGPCFSRPFDVMVRNSGSKSQLKSIFDGSSIGGHLVEMDSCLLPDRARQQAACTEHALSSSQEFNGNTLMGSFDPTTYHLACLAGRHRPISRSKMIYKASNTFTKSEV